MSRIRALLAAGAVLTAFLAGGAFPDQVLAATITVNTTTDELNADGDCSLREAIRAANTNLAVDACTAGSGADTIDVPSGTYLLTIPGSSEDFAATADLDITESLTLNGTGGTVIDGNGSTLNDRVIHITGAFPVSLSRVSIRNGVTNGGGGGIASFGSLTVNDSTVTGNSANGGGGGIGGFGSSLIIEGSTVSANSASGAGGGVYNSGSGTITDSTIAGNFGVGGGLYNQGGSLTVASSTVSGNSAWDDGGGLYNDQGTLTVTNSTVSGNSADLSFGRGGGLANFNGTLTLTSSTVSGNSAWAGGGGGLHNFSGAITAANSIVAGSPSGGNCAGAVAVTSSGYNLSSDGTCAFNKLSDMNNTNPLLGPLAYNGGPTRTHALLAGSPALDAGDPACPPPTTDQRGVARPQGPNCEIGAFEAEDTDGDAIPDTFDYNDDGDGLLDVSDPCPLSAEDYDGFQDADGCPDPDNDFDGICDSGQTSPSCTGSDVGKYTWTNSTPGSTDCRNVPEDFDAFHDTDGCPEPDNDYDGFTDGTDDCPATDYTAGADGVADTGDEPLTTNLVPVQTREDYDGVIDNDGCHDSPEDDYDGDSRGILQGGLPLFRDEREALVLGTDPVHPCDATPTANDEPSPDAWPPDFNDNQSVSITDVLFFKGQLNTASGRFDFDGSGGVSVTDVLYMKFYFNQSCA